MKRSMVLGSFLLVCLVGLASQAVADISSLRGVSEIPVTEPAPELQKFINDKENIARTFEEQPPLVPHDNEKYTITLKENKCLDCHVKQPGKEQAKSVEMSESHFLDRDGNKLDKPSSRRYFCNQCHVPQIDAEPLVGSTFKSASTK
jgi:nitrate reductase (cytochrome), electron transfer subunit